MQRSSAVPESPEDIRIKRLLDEIYMIDPCVGSRRLVTVLQRDYTLGPPANMQGKTRRAATTNPKVAATG